MLAQCLQQAPFILTDINCHKQLDIKQLDRSCCSWGKCKLVSFYPRDTMLARVCESNVSVRLSRTRIVKTKKASVMISSQSGSPTILVF